MGNLSYDDLMGPVPKAQTYYAVTESGLYGYAARRGDKGIVTFDGVDHVFIYTGRMWQKLYTERPEPPLDNDWSVDEWGLLVTDSMTF